MVKTNSNGRSSSSLPVGDGGARNGSEPRPGFAPVIRDFGQTTVGHVTLAKSLYLRGRQQEALAALECALRDNPELAQAHLLKGLVLAQRADFEAARESLTYATRLDEACADGWMALAHVNFELERLAQALNAVERAVRIDENNANALLLQGNILAALDRPAEAIVAYRGAVRSNPQLSTARLKLSNLLALAGDSDEAIRQAIVALRLNPVSSNVRITLGNLYHQLGRLDDALVEYKAAARLGQLAPQQSLGYENMGRVLLEMHEPAGAMAMFQTAIRLNPKAIHSYLRLARIHRDEGNLEEALEMAESAVKIDSRFPEASMLVAELRETLRSKASECPTAPSVPLPSANGHADHARRNGVAHHDPVTVSWAVSSSSHEPLVREVRADYCTRCCVAAADAGACFDALPFQVSIAPVQPSRIDTAGAQAGDELASVCLAASVADGSGQAPAPTVAGQGCLESPLMHPDGL